MIIKGRGLSNEFVNSILNNWPQLRILETDEHEGKVKSDVSRKTIKNYKTLEKIIYRPNSLTLQKLGDGYHVYKVQVDPSKRASAYQPENIVQLGINTGSLTKSRMQEFGSKMTSLENLTIHFDFRNQNRNLEWLPNLKALKTLELWTTEFSIVFLPN